jgi:hypothetical protein
MKSQSLFSSSSRQRLEEFRSKLESSLGSKVSISQKPSVSPARKENSYSRFKDFHSDLHRSITPKRTESPVLSHYRNLSQFKLVTMSPRSPGRAKVELSRKPGILNNFDLLGSFDRNSEKLSDIITVETLSAATSIVARGGVKSIPKVYAAQLKEFCSEVLAHIR